MQPVSHLQTTLPHQPRTALFSVFTSKIIWDQPSRQLLQKSACTNCQKSSYLYACRHPQVSTWLQFVVRHNQPGQMLTFGGVWHFGEVSSSWMNPDYQLTGQMADIHQCLSSAHEKWERKQKCCVYMSSLCWSNASFCPQYAASQRKTKLPGLKRAAASSLLSKWLVWWLKPLPLLCMHTCIECSVRKRRKLISKSIFVSSVPDKSLSTNKQKSRGCIILKAFQF